MNSVRLLGGHSAVSKVLTSYSQETQEHPGTRFSRVWRLFELFGDALGALWVSAAVSETSLHAS